LTYPTSETNYNKGKGCPFFVSEGWVPGGDPGPEPQVAFSCACAIHRLGGRSIRRTCGYLCRFWILLLIIHLPVAVGKSAESAVAITSEFLAKGNYATGCQQNRSRNLTIMSEKLWNLTIASSVFNNISKTKYLYQLSILNLNKQWRNRYYLSNLLMYKQLNTSYTTIWNFYIENCWVTENLNVVGYIYIPDSYWKNKNVCTSIYC